MRLSMTYQMTKHDSSKHIDASDTGQLVGVKESDAGSAVTPTATVHREG